MTLENNATFYELPDAVLKVTEKSNLVRIEKDDKTFVAREIVDSIIAENDIATYTVNYYDVIDGSKVLSLEIKRSVKTNEVLNPEINKKRYENISFLFVIQRHLPKNLITYANNVEVAVLAVVVNTSVVQGVSVAGAILLSRPEFTVCIS